MEAIVQFMYLGEATFYNADKIHDILSVAKNLHIKLLCDTEESQDKYPYEEKASNFDDNKWEVPKLFKMDVRREHQIVQPSNDYGHIPNKIISI